MSAPPPPAGSSAPPAAPPAPVPPPPYPYPGYGYPVPRPRDNAATLIVLLLVAFVVIPAILGVIVLMFFTSFFGGFVPTGPIVVLDNAMLAEGNASIEVRLVSQEHPIDRYGFRLEVNGTESGTTAFPPGGQGPPVSVGGYSLSVRWRDEDLDGQVGVWDTFTVSGVGAPLPPSTSFRFTLSFGGSVLEASESWSTP